MLCDHPWRHLRWRLLLRPQCASKPLVRELCVCVIVTAMSLAFVIVTAVSSKPLVRGDCVIVTACDSLAVSLACVIVTACDSSLA